MSKKISVLLFFTTILIMVLSGCPQPNSPFNSSIPVDESDIYYSDLTDVSDWSDESHGKLKTSEIIENTANIFDTSKVQKMRIVIEPDNWTLMNTNLSDLKQELGRSTDFNSVDNPFFVPCELFYSPDGSDENELEWYKVGIRFKGNSSLFSANSNKLPFKLDFDEFEDTYTDINNQRFYGFKQLSLKSNYLDDSEMHEVVATELFRSFDLVGPHCSYYELYVNVDGGDESDDIYYGLYILVEEIDDTVIKTQYDDDGGNLYKPEDDAASFAYGTYDTDEFGLQTDSDETYTDIKALYDAINDSTRTSDFATWKTNLEELFDVDIFLKWLAANSVMENWDTYGVMAHNFFLYNNPTTGKFEWIPWDNNEALESNSRCLSLDMASVNSDWPLISYILDDSTYTATYKTYVASFANTYFNATYLDPIFSSYSTLIEDSVSSEISGYTFTSSRLFSSSLSTLNSHTVSRNSAALDYANGTD